MKKTLKSRLKKWKIGDYARQFSIVAGGVLLTLWLTGHITDSAKQREVRQAMQLVALELQNNLETVERYEWIYNNEKRMALRLQQLEFKPESLTRDSVLLYQQRLFNGLGNPLRFSTDALEMLKTSGLASHIADKQQMIELLRCYTSLEAFNGTMDLYFNMRKEVLTDYANNNLQTTMPTQREEFIAMFDRMIADRKIQNWLNTLPRGFDEWFFKQAQEQLTETISNLETACK